MSANTEYFMFDEELWDFGFKYNCSYENNKLIINKGQSKAFYLSRGLNSYEFETVWHRMRMDFEIFGDSSIAFSYFAIDLENIEYNESFIELDKFIIDTTIEIYDKLSVLNNFWLANVENSKDIPLFDAKGKYLYFKIEITAYDDIMPYIKTLKIEFPMETFVDYLPEFYKSEKNNIDFFRRFIGIYQNLFIDLEENIDNISQYMDSEFIESEMLNWLSQWVGIEDSFMWSDDKLRVFIKKSFNLYKLKGTKESLINIIELYIGEKPIIIETYEIMKYYNASDYEENYKNLYGSNVYSFTIFVYEKCIPRNQNFIELKRIVDLYKPAHTTANIVVLKNFMELGQHIYIGLNSNVSQNLPLVLDGNSILPFNTSL